MTAGTAPRQEARSGAPAGRRSRRLRRYSGRDRLVLALLVGIPTLLQLTLVWFPAIASVLLSFTKWDGIGGLSSIKWVGFRNYHQIFTIYPPFFPALRHNVYWLAVFLTAPPAFGMFLATQLDKKIRGSRVYQSAIFLPMVLSLAIVGFIWELMYSPSQGLINNLTGHNKQGHIVDWLGNPHLNLWAAIIAASWRQVGYVMILYLAGLKTVDNSLREAAAIDGANEWQTFWRVVWPTLRPINVVVLVISVIESLRAFDIVYVINNGRNGMELLSVLVYDNIVGEASRIGYGSALGVILLVVSLGVIVPYLVQTFRREDR
jgi:ABC-type sugar transport system permease subunit